LFVLHSDIEYNNF